MSYEYTIPRRGLYRSRNGLVFGVCRGAADYFGVSVFWTRVIVVAAFLLTGFWPVGVAYIAAALIMQAEPGALSRCTRTRYERPVPPTDGLRERFSGLDERIQRLETVVTSRERDWDDRLNRSA